MAKIGIRKEYRERTRPNWTKYTTGIYRIILGMNGDPQMDIPLDALHAMLNHKKSAHSPSSKR